MPNSNDTQISQHLPNGIDAWESTLARYFLAIGSGGDASDIHSFEVSAATLALACGVDANWESQVEHAFRSALLRDQNYLLSALKHGSSRRSSHEVPNCFAPLAMTLLIDGLLDDEGYENNQFRAKLANWLGIDRTFNDLAGVKSMWEELNAWLDAQISAGRPFRRLVLPEYPRSWSHIGYTRRLSFPSRADLRAVERTLESASHQDLANPTVVINAFWNCSHRNHISMGLQEAFKDFEQAYYSQRRALADHRFWVLINKVRTFAGAKGAAHAQLEIALTIDDEREFHVAVDGVEGARFYRALTGALADESVRNSPNLGASVARGLVFFSQVSMGRWTAEPDLGKCRGRVLVAYHDKMSGPLTSCVGKADRYEHWRLTVDSVSADRLAAELAKFGLAQNHAVLFKPAASDGVRVNGAWLGLPGFLPQIASDTSDLRISADAGATSLRISAEEFRLIAESPAIGSYVIEPKPTAGERGPHWRLKLHFVDRAAPHYELRGARRRQPLLADWSAVFAARANCTVPDALAWGQGDDSLEWLLEALYASGTSGWDEGDLVDLLRRFDAQGSAAPWRTLKMLQDGGVIEARLRQSWKGRVWTLVAPRIVTVHSSMGTVAVAEGAFCAQMLDAFFAAARGMGATPFRRPGSARWSIPVVAALGADPEKLARILRWEYVAEPDSPVYIPLALAVTERLAERYLVSATWCWRSKRFIKFGANSGAVRLMLLTHPAGTDHDVYRVEAKGGRTHFLSRCAAIVAAHSAAAVPLFAFDGQRLESTGRDGLLPDALCAALRRRRFESGGFSDGVYSYPATAEDARWIAALLPGCVAGLEPDSPLRSSAALSRVRRSNGALRPLWINGQLTI